MIDINEIDQEQARPGDAITDLRAAGKRLGDAALTTVIRRVSWQAARDAQRCAAAEAQAAQSVAQIDVLTRQRDEALARCRTGTPARLEHMAGQLKQVMGKLGETASERDKLRIEVANLQTKLAARANASAKPAEPPKKKLPEALLNVPPVEPDPQETALLAQRAVLVEEQQRLQEEAKRLGKVRGVSARARLTEINAQLAEFAPKVKGFKAARHAELMARQAAALRDEAVKALNSG
jgi:hypothetical protein